MSTFVRYVVLLGCLAISGYASAEILWKGDFETGDLSQWSGTLNPAKGERQNIALTGSTLDGRAAQITIHPDDIFSNGHNRVELRYEGQRTGEGQTTFFSWRFRLGQNAGVHEDIAYWETKGPSYQQSMAFYIDPAGDGTRLGFRTNAPEAREQWTTNIRPDVWYQLAMKIVWRKQTEQGRVSIWMDGSPVVTDVTAQTKPNAVDLFIQMGYHRDKPESPVETIYIDSAVEGTSLEDVLRRSAPSDKNCLE
jgi:hypothetical protein